jgi:NADH:quinone reductase (non-electrogenic)
VMPDLHLVVLSSNRRQVWTAGQVIGLIHDIPTCDDLLTRIEREAVEAMKKTQSLFIEEGQEAVSATGTVDKTSNNPGAEIWGVGKSKL